MRIATLVRLSSLACVVLAACSGEDAGTEEPSNPPTVAQSELDREDNPQVSEADKVALVDGHNAFAFDLFDLIRAEEGAGRNMFFSPTSITLALSMAYAGARNQTADEMAAALHYTLPPERLFPAYNWLDQELESRADQAYERALQEAAMDPNAEQPDRESFRLHIVNSMWGEQTTSFEQPFLDTLAVNYGAGVFLADFKGKPDAERVRINDWVADETQDRIQDLIPPGMIGSLTRSVLVNAIHLKLPWTDPFSTAEDLSFTRPDGSTLQAPAIGERESWPYAEEGGMQAVLIPLEGYNVRLLVVAPAVGDLDAFEEGLSASSFHALLDGMDAREVIYRMPKVNFTTESIQLRSKLEALGMSVPFTGSADFSGITQDEPLHISDVVHKAMLGIDENGVEAAAATAVAMAGSGVPPEPVTFDVDRPFFVGLVDGPTNTLLFAGHIVDPTQ
ncbi:MAG: serpin family protein [Myxococcota bacterium]